MSWALIVTAPNAEHLVVRELRERRCIPHFFFKRVVKRVHRGRVHDNVVPAFPRYIFVPPEVGYQLKYENARVVDVVRSQVDGTMWTVSSSEIQGLIERCNGGDTFPLPEAEAPFKRGDVVAIVGHHAAAGHRAVFQHMLGDNQALVEFDWLGRMVPTAVDLRDIEKHEPKKRRRRSHRRVKKLKAA